jgi:hypothetical protein
MLEENTNKCLIKNSRYKGSIKKKNIRRDIVVHIYNPSCFGRGKRRITVKMEVRS